MKCQNCDAAYWDGYKFICRGKISPYLLKKSKMWGCSYNNAQVNKMLRETPELKEIYRVTYGYKDDELGWRYAPSCYFYDRAAAVKFSSSCIGKYESVCFEVVDLTNKIYRF